MRTRKMVMILAVVAMVMGAMAPASAAKGGISKNSLEAKGYFCFDNSGPPDFGAGNHCTKGVDNMDELFAYLGGDGGTGNLHVKVFSPDSLDGGATFYGTELLGWKNGALFAQHHWKGGVERP